MLTSVTITASASVSLTYCRATASKN